MLLAAVILLSWAQLCIPATVCPPVSSLSVTDAVVDANGVDIWAVGIQTTTYPVRSCTPPTPSVKYDVFLQYRASTSSTADQILVQTTTCISDTTKPVLALINDYLVLVCNDYDSVNLIYGVTVNKYAVYGGALAHQLSASQHTSYASSADTIQVAYMSTNKLGIYMQAWTNQLLELTVTDTELILQSPQASLVAKTSGKQIIIGAPQVPTSGVVASQNTYGITYQVTNDMELYFVQGLLNTNKAQIAALNAVALGSCIVGQITYVVGAYTDQSFAIKQKGLVSRINYAILQPVPITVELPDFLATEQVFVTSDQQLMILAGWTKTAPNTLLVQIVDPMQPAATPKQQFTIASCSTGTIWSVTSGATGGQALVVYSCASSTTAQLLVIDLTLYLPVVTSTTKLVPTRTTTNQSRAPTTVTSITSRNFMTSQSSNLTTKSISASFAASVTATALQNATTTSQVTTGSAPVRVPAATTSRFSTQLQGQKPVLSNSPLQSLTIDKTFGLEPVAVPGVQRASSNEASVIQATVFTAPPVNTTQLDGSSLVPFIGAAVGVFLLLFCIIAYVAHRKRKQRPLATQSATMLLMDDLSATQINNHTSTIDGTVFAGTMLSGSTTLGTIVNDQREMSLPGWLMVHEGYDYQIGRVLAQGGFAKIHIAKLQTNNVIKQAGGATQCAIKIITPSVKQLTLAERDDQERAFLQEVAIMNFFRNSKHMVKLIGYTQQPRQAMLMKLYNLGSVADCLSGKSPVEYSQELALSLLRDVAEALCEMHKNGFVHSDIKVSNILLDSDDGQDQVYAVLTDFGITQIVTADTLLVQQYTVSKFQGISVNYSAPEILKIMTGAADELSSDPEQLYKLDVFAYCIVAWEMLQRQPVHGDLSSVDQFQVANRVLQGLRPQWTIDTRQIQPLVEQCEQGWRAEAAERPAMSQFLQLLKQR